MTAPVIELKGVSRYFRDRHGGVFTAVDEVSFSIGAGEILGLVGESGSGKTTIGRMSVGLTRVSKGEILLQGVDVSKTKNMKEVWKKAQYIHQDPYSALDPYMTVREAVERPLRFLMEIPQESRKERMTSLLEVIGLSTKYLPKRIQELSGGERQRVLIARAFICTPVYVVADEPTSMVDFVHRNSIIELLRNLKKEFSTSFLVITHDLSVAADICDTIAIMRKGRILEYGTKDQMLSSPKEDYTKALLSATPEHLVSGQTEAIPESA